VMIWVKEAFVQCSKHIPPMRRIDHDIQWGSDTGHQLQCGDYFGTAHGQKVIDGGSRGGKARPRRCYPEQLLRRSKNRPKIGTDRKVIRARNLAQAPSVVMFRRC
jgi:hypothetical protein